MASVLQNVSNAAVWGSLLGSLILGTFLAIQAALHRDRRTPFAVFAVACLAIAMLDFFHAQFSYFTYEKLRIAAWTMYSATLLWLFRHSLRSIIAVSILLPASAIFTWLAIDPALATSCVVPVAFYVSALVHAQTYRATRGFGSCVLAVYSFALGMLCTTYYLFLKSGDPDTIGLGYIHYALLSCTAVVFGWIHVSRELRGRLPVQVSVAHASIFGAVILLGEVGILLSVLVFPHWPPISYMALSLMQLGGVSGLFFYYRHQLVIYTDNVTQLLEERTLSLREAQKTLAQINSQQAEELARQALDIQTKAATIDRQRRLELAAQTAGQAAHDIQNLVAPMLTYLGQLERGEVDKENVTGVAGLVRRQADELLDLNSQLLALARRGRREHHSLELHELLTDITKRFPTTRVRFNGEQGVWVKGAWSQISRAVSNLLSNAVDATEELPLSRQMISIKLSSITFDSVRRCHLGFLAPGSYAAIEVTDQGKGIPAASIEHIFEPFFSSKSGKGRSGSGLGLSIVSAVVDDHSGIIDLQTDHHGTRFTLFFPTVSAEPQVIALDKIRGSARILLIDDDEAILDQYSEFLEQAGHFVTSATSGDEGLRALQLEQFDLLLLDLNMPSRNGYETLFAAIQLRPGIKAIIHSSFVTEDDRVRLGQLGVDFFLQKPASRGEVLKVIRQVTEAANDEQTLGRDRVVNR